MLRRAASTVKPFLRGLHSNVSDNAHHNVFTNRGTVIALTSIFAVGSVTWYTSSTTIQNDSATDSKSQKAGKDVWPSFSFSSFSDPAELHTLVWGSNRDNVLSPDQPSEEIIRVPAVAKFLEGVALRDLALHQKHGACVDARGDIYQWGDTFFGEDYVGERCPKQTLKGKNIKSLQLTESKLYALSASGKVYVLPTNLRGQELPTGFPTPASDSWWGTGFLWGEEEAVNFVELSPQEKFGWGEYFTSISAGKHHLLAVTSKGRTYAHPVDKHANHYGQLGFRRFEIPDPAATIAKRRPSLQVELIPKIVADPYSSSTRGARTVATTFTSENLASIDDSSIKFCPSIFEIPSLRGVDIEQVAAGGRSSFARTKTGRVLGWGANEYGQIGLGNARALNAVIVPTEVVLWNMISRNITSKCLDVAAGGDLTAFTVERISDASAATVDVLLCGNGQLGGLGNNSYSNAQSNPTRAKNVSGLVQFNDATGKLEPIVPQEISMSPTGHVLLSLNSSAPTDPARKHDLMLWGRNMDSELGNGRRSSLAAPNVLEKPDGERFMLMAKTAKEVKDMKGNVWKRGVKVEQHAVGGFGNSVVYWKVI